MESTGKIEEIKLSGPDPGVNQQILNEPDGDLLQKYLPQEEPANPGDDPFALPGGPDGEIPAEMPPPLIETPEEKREKRQVIAIIKQYLGSVFAEHLEEYKSMDFLKMPVSEVKEKLEEMEEFVMNAEASSHYRNQFLMASYFTEHLCVNQLGINAKGLTSQLSTNEKLLRNVDLVVLRRRLQISPESMILTSVLGTIMVLHNQNGPVKPPGIVPIKPEPNKEPAKPLTKKQKKKLDEKAPDAIQKDFKDI